MRDIRFRAWGSKTMIYLDDMSWGAFWDSVDQTYNNAYILMQYTGLKDKNGVEIYEGDIVRFPYITPMGDIGDKENEYSYYGEIAFENGCFIMKPIKADSGYYGNKILWFLIEQKIYIIGNVYENPELLNGQD